MSLSLDLPEALTEALAIEAARLGLSLPDYAVHLLASASLRPGQVSNGAELVSYWRDAGLIGSRADLTDSQAHARSLRQRAERRDHE